MWLYQLIAPGQPFFNIALRARLAGDVDVAILERALDEIVMRHTVLRSRYQGFEGKILVTIAPETTSRLRFSDLSELAERERRDVLEEQGQAETNADFDLAQGPLFRFHLLRLGVGESVIGDLPPHRLRRVVGERPAARDSGALRLALGRTSLSLDRLPVRRRLRAVATDSDPALVAQLEYWKAKLAEPLPRFGAATPRFDPAPSLIGAGEMDREPVTVPPESVAALRSVAHREGATFFMATLAAFQGALSHAFGVADVRVGTLVPTASAGRRRG